MDEIFDRIMAKKFRKRDLYPLLIFVEFLGIITLIWYLKVPLSEKYLTVAPSNYSLEQMDSKKQYLIRKGDLISGKTLPNSTLQILLYPDGSKYALLSDDKGNFSFTIPEKVRESEYRLIIVNDNIDKLAAIEDQRIRIRSNSKIDFLLKLFK